MSLKLTAHSRVFIFIFDPFYLRTNRTADSYFLMAPEGDSGTGKLTAMFAWRQRPTLYSGNPPVWMACIQRALVTMWRDRSPQWARPPALDAAASLASAM